MLISELTDSQRATCVGAYPGPCGWYHWQGQAGNRRTKDYGAMEDLGDFLRSRRSRLSPEDVGLRTYGERRRVPGLRREELAQLAGVSVAYYTRLEQGQSRNASEGVLDALGGALRLDADETAHLRALARFYRAPAKPRP